MFLNCLFDACCLFQSVLKPMRCHKDEEFSYLRPEILMFIFKTPCADLALSGHEVFKEAFANLTCLHL